MGVLQLGISTTKKQISTNRKIRKPLMEKKRRDRINCCLQTLASLITNSEAVPSTEGPKSAKLEKADILDLTVKYWNKENQKLENVELAPCAPLVEKEDNANDGLVMLHEEKKGENEQNISTNRTTKTYYQGYKACIKMVGEIFNEFAPEPSTVHLKDELLTHLYNTLYDFHPKYAGKIVSTNCTDLVVCPEKLTDGRFALVYRKSPEEKNHYSPPLQNSSAEENVLTSPWRPW